MLHNPFPVATYLNCDYYSGGAGALVPNGSLMPSGYRQYSPYYPTAALGNYMASAYQQYQHPYSYIGQHPYSYGYGYGGPGGAAILPAPNYDALLHGISTRILIHRVPTVSAFLVATCITDIPTTIMIMITITITTLDATVPGPHFPN
ncbi:hypothetical protein BS47DRAFT_1352862 [Hydnum rufescens UP504]|uniref:Uncharacterized protein n=1 Tax=Hydnum rufescens UP504 TaxID=1448309 RepID=A0A9P6DLY0_9AGAM|nr:hypothetical protein BS47DRAFT_1352862 [Hydnum rufescens UP504]